MTPEPLLPCTLANIQPLHQKEKNLMPIPIEAEKVRVAAFDVITMEDGEWDGPSRDDDVMSYKARTNGVSLTVLLGGKKVFDGDFNKGAQIRIVENVVHLPEGSVPD